MNIFHPFKSMARWLRSTLIKLLATLALAFVGSIASANTGTADFSEAFGETTIENNVFIFPSYAQDWGGFANMNVNMFPLQFSEAGSVTFNAAVANGGFANILFRFEYRPYPDVEPSYDAAAVTVSGSTMSSYTVVIPSQGANTFSSMIMYIVERDVAVTITDVVVTSDSDVVDEPVGPTTLAVGDAIDFETDVAIEGFGGVYGSIVGGVFEAVKTAGAETWGGNIIARGGYVFPLTATDTLMTVDVYSTVAATIRMKLELAADGSQSAEVDSTVAHTGSGWETLTFDFAGTNAIDANFDVLVLFPNFGAAGAGNTYQYDNVTFAGGVAPEPEVPTTVSVTFQVDMSAVETNADGVYLAAGGVFGQDGVLLADNGSDVWSVTVDLPVNTQVLYKFRNQPSYGTWDGFEDPAGLIAGGCNTGAYNDRFVDVAEADIVLDVVAYGSCNTDPFIPAQWPPQFTIEEPAPVPTDAADSVLSIFGTTYGNLDGTDFNPNWGQSTLVDVGDNLVYSNLNYQGTEFANQDVSGYEYLNVDYYVTEGTQLNFFVISPGAEAAYALDVSSQNQWNSVQIPLSHYADVVNLANVFQFKVDGDALVAFNNIYFGKQEILKNGDVIEFSPLSIGPFGGAEAFVANGVVEVIKHQGAAMWAGNVITSGKYIFPLDETQSVLSADVFSTVPANIRMVLHPSENFLEGIELEVLHEGNGWQTLTWDFKEVNEPNAYGNMIDISSVSNLDTLMMMPNFGMDGAGMTYKYDNFIFGGYSQKVSVNNSPKGVLGKTTTLEVSYDTGDKNNQLSGLGLRIHFNSSLLNFNQITNLVDQDIIVNGQGPFTDDDDFDNDPLTDQYILFGWASLYNNWPDTDLPAVLMNISFDVFDAIDTDVFSVTSINFSDTALAAGYEKDFESYELELISTTWDFDGNGVADALSDGLMMLRYCFGLRGEFVTALAMSPESSMTSSEVVAEIESALDIADIDDDGEVGALTDGLMLLRYLFGLKEDILTAGAVSPNGNRSSIEEIEAYLETYMPPM